MTELFVKKYKVQTTGADGGHNYILTEIDFKGNRRKLVILFSDKSQEPDLNENEPIKVKGEIKDDGIEYDLMMRNAQMEK
ncbi:hypothetical protein [Flagellimonas onchidii]|uniref:hypothetical protein n=1 Tax=Flagellimonas onchidii TaxID=2562684 RepID=UPI0010A65AFA|nr:hypothetical protein [Allomuricauda onchidii]